MSANLTAPAPTRVFFDPFNSSSTGHQRAENRLSGSSGWRASRSNKLAHQFGDSSGRGGEIHFSDTVGAGSQAIGRNGGASSEDGHGGRGGSSERGCQDIRTLMKKRKRAPLDVCGRPKDGEKIPHSSCTTATGMIGGRIGRPPPDADQVTSASLSRPSSEQASRVQLASHNGDQEGLHHLSADTATRPSSQIFRSLSLYVNGSTLLSGVSDQRVKSLFVQGGGTISLSLERRSVTHVLLSSSGLHTTMAAEKMQKEITKRRGKGLKFVTAAWVVDSVKAGKRLSESRYQAAVPAMKGQSSVRWETLATKDG